MFQLIISLIPYNTWFETATKLLNFKLFFYEAFENVHTIDEHTTHLFGAVYHLIRINFFFKNKFYMFS